VIYEWEGPKELKEPTPTTKVNFAYYPIISESHPYLQRVGEALERYGSWDDIPESERPVFDDFSVLVRSERYKVVRAVPGPDWDQADAVQGLIVNGVRSLGVEERNLLGSSFPTLNLDRVLILEEGRTPSSMTSCLGLLGSGAALLLAALYFVLVKRRASGLAAPPPLVELPGVV
jgi:hypothetical protein